MSAGRNDTVKVRLVRSPIGCARRVHETLSGLGLRRLGSEKLLRRSPAVAGMIRRVRHLVVEIKE